MESPPPSGLYWDKAVILFKTGVIFVNSVPPSNRCVKLREKSFI
jgi:hypothetical protein